MTFGEKLKLLRKEKGYSQEEFSELVGVSRQAVSKWESDRGMPEIEKILQMSNMYGVTLDYLLKGEATEGEVASDGYYVSQEMIDSFLSYKKKQFRIIAIGIGLIIASDTFSCFSDFKHFLMPFYWGSMALGIAILVWNLLQPKQYHEIYTTHLVFDDSIIKELRDESNRHRKRYALMIVASVLLFFFGTELVFAFENIIGREMCNALDWITDAIAVMLLIVAGGGIHSENMLTHNEKYIEKRTTRGKYAWIYIALPITGIAIIIGFTTNAWSPVFPIIVLFCALLITVCKLLLEKRDGK